jgi:hypothetical protein
LIDGGAMPGGSTRDRRSAFSWLRDLGELRLDLAQYDGSPGASRPGPDRPPAHGRERFSGQNTCLAPGLDRS